MNRLFFAMWLLSTNAFALNATVIEVLDGNTIKVLDATNLMHTVSLADKNAPIINQTANENSKKGLVSLILGKNVSIKESGKDEKGQILGQVFLDGLDVNKATRPIGNPPKPTVAETPILEQPKQIPPQKTQLTEPTKPITPPVSKQSPPIQQKVEQKQIIEQPEIEEKTVEKKKTIKKSRSSSRTQSDYSGKQREKERTDEKIREFATKERIKTNEKLKIIREKEALKDDREAKKEAKKERKEAEKEDKKERKKAERKAKKEAKKTKKSKKDD